MNSRAGEGLGPVRTHGAALIWSRVLADGRWNQWVLEDMLPAVQILESRNLEQRIL